MCVHLIRVVRTGFCWLFVFLCVWVCVLLQRSLNWVCVWQTTLKKVRSSAKAIHARSSCLKILVLLTAFANYFRIKEELVEALLYLSKTSNFRFMTQEKAQIYRSCFYLQRLRIVVTWKPVESWRIRLLIHPLALYSSCQNYRRGHGLTFSLDELIILISRPLNLHVNQALKFFWEAGPV